MGYSIVIKTDKKIDNNDLVVSALSETGKNKTWKEKYTLPATTDNKHYSLACDVFFNTDENEIWVTGAFGLSSGDAVSFTKELLAVLKKLGYFAIVTESTDFPELIDSGICGEPRLSKETSPRVF